MSATEKVVVADGAAAGETFRNQWRSRKVREGWIDPAQLLANPDNWRIHPENQQRAMETALDTLGWLDEIKLQEGSDLVFNGHMRTALAITKGELVPAAWYDLSDAEVALALESFDSIASFAVKDQAKLAELRAASAAQDGDLAALLAQHAAADAAALAALAAQVAAAQPKRGHRDPDLVPEPPATPIVQAGELWILGQHKLLIGDSTVAADVARLLAGERVTLTYTDPPYGVSYVGGHKRREMIEGDDAEGDALDELFLAPFLVTNQYRAAQCAVMVWFAGNVPAPLDKAIAATGWKIRAQIMWLKNLAQFGAFSAQYHVKHEPLLYCVQGKGPPKWHGGTTETTVWACNRSASNEYHPTQKPPELAERAMTNHTDPGDIVLDLYGGSGATLVAGEKLDRPVRMMEKDPQYGEVILRRWAAFTGEDPVREDGVSLADLAAEAGRALELGEGEDDAEDE